MEPATPSSEQRPYPGVTEPMAPALMRRSHEWAMTFLIDHLHAGGFTDIRLSHMPVLAFPGPDGQRPTELADRTGRSKQHINILLGELEGAGYLQRRVDSDDRRGKVIQLTDRGMHLAAAIKEAVEQVEAHWRQALGDRRFGALKRSLQDLEAALQTKPSQAEASTSPLP